MLTLFLDFASHKKSIGLVDENRTIALEPIDDHADESTLMPMIEKLLGKTKSIDRVAAVTGPGGFMSLRVGLSIANAFAWSLKIPAAGIHLSDVWHARVTNEKNFLWVHSTKKEMLFVRGFGDIKNIWSEPMVISPSDCHLSLPALPDEAVAKSGTRSLVPFVGELIETQALALPALKRIETIQPLEDVLPKLLNALTYGKDSVMPWYGRGA